MKRRALLTLGAGAAAWVAAWVLAAQRPAPAAFTHGRESLSGQGLPGARLVDLNPDRMWPVYRRYHLLIVSQRDDERSGVLTAAVVDVLSHHLPGFSPPAGQRRGRAAHRRSHRDQSAGRRHHAGRERRGPLSCQAAFRRHPRSAVVIVSFGSHVLVCRPISWPVMLTSWRRRLPGTGRRFLPPQLRPNGVVPAHRGARAFFAGEELPND